MEIALFSDVHANLPALEALFGSIEHHRPDSLYCLGDLVGYNVWPNEVIHEIRRRQIPTIAGNYDFGVGRNSNDCGCGYRTDEQKANGAASISYTNQVIGASERSYLRTLPAHIKVEFQLGQDRLNLLLVHGSPRRINEYLYEDRDESSMLRIMEEADADILCFGHTHKPYHRVLSGNQGYRHAINVGTVGMPVGGDPRGCYVLLRIDEGSSNQDKESIQVRFIRFAYDHERAASAVERSPLPRVFAAGLRTGY